MIWVHCLKTTITEVAIDYDKEIFATFKAPLEKCKGTFPFDIPGRPFMDV